MVVRVGNTIAFPFHCCFCMRIHMRVPMFLWKHIPSVMFFNNHMYSCGNTFSRHTRLQSFFCLIFLSLCRNTYVFTCCSGYIPNETYARFHANLFWSSFKKRKTPGFEVLRRRPLRHHICICSHASREFLPHLNRKIVLPYGTSVPGEKHVSFFYFLFFWNVFAIWCFRHVFLTPYLVFFWPPLVFLTSCFLTP